MAPITITTALKKTIGYILLLHYILVVCIKWYFAQIHDLVWLSHASLLLSTFAFIFNSRLAYSTAITLILIPHAVWITESVIFLITDKTYFGLQLSWQEPRLLSFLGTMHHFYLLPLLLITARSFSFHPQAWLHAGFTFWLLTIISSLTSPTHNNVNFVFQLLPGTPLQEVLTLHAFDNPWYLIQLNTLALFFIFLPSAIFNAWMHRQFDETCSSTPHKI